MVVTRVDDSAHTTRPVVRRDSANLYDRPFDLREPSIGEAKFHGALCHPRRRPAAVIRMTERRAPHSVEQEGRTAAPPFGLPRRNHSHTRQTMPCNVFEASPNSHLRNLL